MLLSSPVVEVLRRVCRYVRLDYVSAMDSGGGGGATRLVPALGGGVASATVEGEKVKRKKPTNGFFFSFFNLAIS